MEEEKDVVRGVEESTGEGIDSNVENVENVEKEEKEEE
jgi:hypothetical protein